MAGTTKKNSPGCATCGCGGSGGGPCAVTVNLSDCLTGTGISGATILTGLGGTTLGTTDSSGNFTFAAGSGSAYIQYAGVGYGFSYGAGDCAGGIHLCYFHAKVTVTCSAPDAHVGVSGLTDEGAGVFTWKRISSCGDATALPPTPICAVSYSSGLPDPLVYIPNCISSPLACGDDITIDIPMFNFTSDYWAYESSCDEGCGSLAPTGCDGGTVGDGPDHRGVIPKVLHATFHDSPPGNVPVFLAGSLAGVAIALTWDGNPLPAGIWDSGCLPNTVTSTLPPGPCANHTRVTIQLVSGDWQVNFSSSLDVGAPCSGPGCSLGSLAVPVPLCQLTAPVDFIGDDATGQYFTITE